MVVGIPTSYTNFNNTLAAQRSLVDRHKNSNNGEAAGIDQSYGGESKRNFFTCFQFPIRVYFFKNFFVVVGEHHVVETAALK